MSFPFSVPSHGIAPFVDARAPAGPITARQLEIIGLVVEGLTNIEIADRLEISHRTVQSHVASSMQRLHAASRTQLAVTALRAGLVPLHPTSDARAAGARAPGLAVAV